ncbi:MAG: UPF0149 family protein [Allgaiera sp.]|jgi:yecA family protein|nr:UPF0149 family protein [Allgaiera sp.]
MTAAHVPEIVAHLASIEDDREQSRAYQEAARHLLDDPESVVTLQDGLCQTQDTAMDRITARSTLLTAVLDEARMAHENGQRKGAAFLSRMTEALEHKLAEIGGLSTAAALRVSAAWTRAGLAPPERLVHAMIPGDAEPLSGDGTIPEIPDEMFADLFQGFNDLGEQSVSALVGLLDEMLPTLPPEARHALVRKAASRREDVFGEVAAALLLKTDKSVVSGALAGLETRHANGDFSRSLLTRLTLLRSWSHDDETRQGIDTIVRAALKDSATSAPARVVPRIHRVVSSMVDGSGSQSFAFAVQSGGRRHVAVVLLKQGFGVKDAFCVPCGSATEQRQMIGGIAEQAESLDVTADYAQMAIAFALGDGLAQGRAPAAGLVDVVEVVGFDELRPRDAGVAAFVEATDPEGRVAGLSKQARGRLIMASEDWPDRYSLSDSWFEDSDAASEAIETGTTETTVKRNLWRYLETRRGFWAMMFARNALLLRSAGRSDAEGFAAVAQALQDGRDLKKIPVMDYIHFASLQAWFATLSGGTDTSFAAPGLEVSEGRAPAGMQPPVPSFGRPERAELDRLLRPAMITVTWIEGFLSGLCTAPEFIRPSVWIGTIFNVVGEHLEAEDDLQRILDLITAAYNHVHSNLRDDAPGEALCPTDPILFSIWADGYLTAWEGHKYHWPVRALGKDGKKIRRLLESAADQKTPPELITVMPAWLRHRAKQQK